MGYFPVTNIVDLLGFQTSFLGFCVVPVVILGFDLRSCRQALFHHKSPLPGRVIGEFLQALIFAPNDPVSDHPLDLAEGVIVFPVNHGIRNLPGRSQPL